MGEGTKGSDAIAASGVAGIYIWLAMGVMLLASVGGGIGVSQSLSKFSNAGSTPTSATGRNATDFATTPSAT
jgi:Na+-driven multidrug efflux pump